MAEKLAVLCSLLPSQRSLPRVTIPWEPDCSFNETDSICNAAHAKDSANMCTQSTAVVAELGAQP